VCFFFAGDPRFVARGSKKSIGQSLVAGRDFSPADARTTPRVVVVNQSLARHFFGDANPIGRRMDPDGGTNYTREIVGVVRDAAHLNLKETPQRVFYVAYAQSPSFVSGGSALLLARAAVPIASIVQPIRRAISDIDSNVLVDTEPLASFVSGSIARERLLASLGAALGAVSLALVALGLYGVMAYAVTRRTAEIGLRIAFGASRRAVLSMVLGDGFRLVAIGIAAGTGAAYWLALVLTPLLFGIAARDAVTFAAAVVTLAVAALTATAVPALRASRLDPLVALRHE
jgi:putative ABC transport system permease protein